MSTQSGTATSYLDLLNKVDSFLTTTGHAWGLTFTGTGNGRLTGHIGTSTSVVETVTVTATSATSFSVVGSVSGALGTATVGTPFTSSKCAFTITAGTTAFVAGDVFTFNLSPKWTRLRMGGCPEPGYRTTTNFTNGDYLWNNAGFGVYSQMATASTFPATATVQMGVATEVRLLSMWTGVAANGPKDFSLQWSDNGSTWTTAQSWTSQTWTAEYQRRDFTIDTPPGAHLYWRINITASNGATLNLIEARLFADILAKWDVSSRMEFAWSAPGIDGAQTIYAAGHTDCSNAADYFNLSFRGFRYWTDQALSVLDVPASSGGKTMLLSKTAIAYWLIVHGGRAILVTRINTVYQFAYLGFGLPYEAPSAHPFPLLIGAPYPGTGVRYDLNNTALYRNPCDPGGVNASTTSGGLAAFMPSNTFVPVCNRSDNGSTEGVADPAANGRGKTWPYTTGSDGGPQVENIRDNVDGTKPLLPVVIHVPLSEHLWGEFDGVYWTTGFTNNAENLIRDGALDHLVVPNVNRSGINHFAAIALD